MLWVLYFSQIPNITVCCYYNVYIPICRTVTNLHTNRTYLEPATLYYKSPHYPNSFVFVWYDRNLGCQKARTYLKVFAKLLRSLQLDLVLGTSIRQHGHIAAVRIHLGMRVARPSWRHGGHHFLTRNHHQTREHTLSSKHRGNFSS